MPQFQGKIAHRNLLSIYKESPWRFNKTELYFDANKLCFSKKSTSVCAKVFFTEKTERSGVEIELSTLKIERSRAQVRRASCCGLQFFARKVSLIKTFKSSNCLSSDLSHGCLMHGQASQIEPV